DTGRRPRENALSGGLDRGAVEDVVLGDLDLAQPERAHHLDQDQDARHDRRGATGMKAREVEALVERLRRQDRAEALDGVEGEQIAVDHLWVVRIELLLDRRQR